MDQYNTLIQSNIPPPPTPPKPVARLTSGLRWYRKISKKQWILLGVALVLIGTGGVVAFLNNRPTKSVVSVSQRPAGPPQPITSKLTGLPATDADNQRPVTGVMIENSVFARPQSGLREAGVVFEAIAEAGITRFLALYQEAQPANIGPIRSVRPYYLDWVSGFDAPISHVGGSPEALQNIKVLKLKDLDQFYNAGAYHRISSREAPHNMYSSMAALNKLEQDKGWFTPGTWTGFPRKKESPSKVPNANHIDLGISGPTYSVHYDYDAKNNAYLRSEGGAPHLDAETKQQLEPKVVISLLLPYSLEKDGYHSDYATIGSGPMTVFQDGIAVNGTWKKTSPTSQIQFLDATGSPIKLNPGQTWISVISAASDLSVKP